MFWKEKGQSLEHLIAGLSVIIVCDSTKMFELKLSFCCVNPEKPCFSIKSIIVVYIISPKGQRVPLDPRVPCSSLQLGIKCIYEFEHFRIYVNIFNVLSSKSRLRKFSSEIHGTFNSECEKVIVDFAIYLWSFGIFKLWRNFGLLFLGNGFYLLF